jgi:guanine deaminase
VEERTAEFLHLAVQEALDGVRAGDGGPFGAVVVRGDDVLAQAHNSVVATNDPTAHAEVLAIRAACAALGSYQLDGCELYVSCEPCPMCLGAIYWARPRAVVFAATRQDAAAVGFDDALIYEELPLAVEDRTLPMRRVAHPDAGAPFAAWLSKPDRVEY